jgi:hypothetical protein
MTSVSRIHKFTAFYKYYVALIEVTMSKGSTIVFHESVFSENCINSGQRFNSSNSVRCRETCFNNPLFSNELYSLVLLFRALDSVYLAVA